MWNTLRHRIYGFHITQCPVKVSAHPIQCCQEQVNQWENRENGEERKKNIPELKWYEPPSWMKRGLTESSIAVKFQNPRSKEKIQVIWWVCDLAGEWKLLQWNENQLASDFLNSYRCLKDKGNSLNIILKMITLYGAKFINLRVK